MLAIVHEHPLTPLEICVGSVIPHGSTRIYSHSRTRVLPFLFLLVY